MVTTTEEAANTHLPPGVWDYKAKSQLRIDHILPRTLPSLFSGLCVRQDKGQSADGEEKGPWRVLALLVYSETHLCHLNCGQRTLNQEHKQS